MLAVASALVIAPAAAALDAPRSASWHGQAIQEPQPGDAVKTAASFPRGWSAGPVGVGSGFRRADGSERVREVQDRLWKLGYRPGPVDGLFGSRTQAAVEWFQVKHGIKPDGVVGLSTLNVLRQRTGAAPEPVATSEPVRDARERVRGAAPQPSHTTQFAVRSQKPAGGHGGGLSLLLLLLAVPAALAMVALHRSRRTAPPSRAERRQPDPPVADRTPGPAPTPTPAPPAAASPEESTAIGYVRAGDRAELARHARAIRRACTERGWTVTQLVCDDQQASARRSAERPGLAAAKGHLAGAGPSRLVVSKLAHLSRSPADLTALFEWFDRNGVEVIATDVGLDTTTPRGRQAAHSQLADYSRRQARARANGRNGGRKKAKVDDNSVRA